MNKNPYLQYRHAEGLGDIIACTLHSKLISPITYLLTGKKEMCASCDKRRQALNFLFPIKMWKLFFSDYDAKENDLDSYFQNKNVSDEEDSISDEVKEDEPILEEKHEEHIITGLVHRDLIPKNATILRESETEINGLFFKTIIYSK